MDAFGLKWYDCLCNHTIRQDGESMSMPKLLRIKPLDAYPIGSIYMSLDSISPADIFGGVWERLKDKFLMPAGDTYVAGTTGGSAEQTLLVENMPAHTHTRGTMNITGDCAAVGGSEFKFGPFSGAFSSSTWVDYYGKTTNTTTSAGRYDGFQFNASNSWTGETSSEGGGASFSVIPPYITVYAWRRIF